MRTSSFFNRMLSIAAFVSLFVLGTGFSSSPQVASELEGTWLIDLRPEPNAAPYIQRMVITSTKGNKLQGTFYDSKIMNGKINTSWGKVVFAFTTRDGSGDYHTVGTLENGKLTGTTHSIGRGFVSPWTGERK